MSWLIKFRKMDAGNLLSRNSAVRQKPGFRVLRMTWSLLLLVGFDISCASCRVKKTPMSLEV
jgi:hypothetical protein